LINTCPHQGAPLCLGKLNGTYRPSPVHSFVPALEGRVLRCPWHGWEFDVVTGKGLYDRTGRVATFPVIVNAKNEVVVCL
jgi:nitrite reductase/ring-hydroxylating ferredoxin subunit